MMHIHGSKDAIVPYENLSFSKKVFDNQILRTRTIEGENHFLPWDQYEFVKKELIQLIEEYK